MHDYTYHSMNREREREGFPFRGRRLFQRKQRILLNGCGVEERKKLVNLPQWEYRDMAGTIDAVKSDIL
jgi:hypothetical protein